MLKITKKLLCSISNVICTCEICLDNFPFDFKHPSSGLKY